MGLFITSNIFYHCVAVTVCILDIAASFANMTVYSRQRRDAFAWYLLGLTLADLVYVLMQIVQSLCLLLTGVRSFTCNFITIYMYAFFGISCRRVAINILFEHSGFLRTICCHSFPVRQNLHKSAGSLGWSVGGASRLL